MHKIKEILRGIWQSVSYLSVPQWGSKRRQAQAEYEEKLDELMLEKESLAKK